MAPVYLPFVDIETTRGYAISYVFHFACDLIAVFGFIGTDLVLILFVIHYMPLVEVFRLRVFQFSYEISLNRNQCESTEAYQYFVNVITMHKEMLK